MEYLGGLIFIILLVITLIAFFMCLSLLFSRRVSLSEQAAKDMTGRSFLLGLINTFFFAALIIGFLALADGTGIQFFFLPVLFLLVIYLIFLAYGLAGLVQLTGTRLLPDASQSRQRILGALTLILGCMTPFVGWFGLLFYLCLLGFGSFILSYFHKPNTAVSPDFE